MRHPRIKRDAEDERPEKSDSRLGRKKQHETTTITPPRSSSEQSKVCMKQANATECKYGTMQSRTFSTRIRVLVPRLDSRSCLVSFAHALFKGLAETLQSASFRMYSECIHFTICLQRKMKKSTLSTALSTAFSAFSHALLALGTSFRSPAAWLKGWSNC